MHLFQITYQLFISYVCIIIQGFGKCNTFLQKIEEKVSKETIDKFYAMVKPVNANNRWYDKDPVISKTVEILRIVPPEAQKICAQNFIRTLKEMGIEYVSPNGTESGK